MKLAILASLLAGAAAFTPTSKVGTTRGGESVATSMAFENELGAQEPLGFFDPLGLVTDGDIEKFERLRYVEIKHGRIAMLAVVGFLTTAAGVRLPGPINYSGTMFTDIPGGFSAIKTLDQWALIQIFAFVGLLELLVMKEIINTAHPGDFRNDFLDFGWEEWDEETKIQKRAIELNNGRAAMMGILGLMVHSQLGVPILPGGILE